MMLQRLAKVRGLINNINCLVINRKYHIDMMEIAYIHKELQRAKAILTKIHKYLLAGVLDDIDCEQRNK